MRKRQIPHPLPPGERRLRQPTLFILVEQLLAPLTRPVHLAPPVPPLSIIHDLRCRAPRFRPRRLSPAGRSAYEAPGRTLTIARVNNEPLSAKLALTRPLRMHRRPVSRLPARSAITPPASAPSDTPSGKEKPPTEEDLLASLSEEHRPKKSWFLIRQKTTSSYSPLTVRDWSRPRGFGLSVYSHDPKFLS